MGRAIRRRYQDGVREHLRNGWGELTSSERRAVLAVERLARDPKSVPMLRHIASGQAERDPARDTARMILASRGALVKSHAKK